VESPQVSETAGTSALESVAWVDKDTPVPGTTTVSTTKYAVSNETITVPVDVTNPFYAYRLLVTPANPVGVSLAAPPAIAEGVYRIYEPSGRNVGCVSHGDGTLLESEVGAVVSRPGLYLVRSVAARPGEVLRVLVGAH